MALTNAQMQAIVAAGGSVIWPPGATGSAITTIAALPSDAAIAAYFAANPTIAPAYDRRKSGVPVSAQNEVQTLGYTGAAATSGAATLTVPLPAGGTVSVPNIAWNATFPSIIAAINTAAGATIVSGSNDALIQLVIGIIPRQLDIIFLGYKSSPPLITVNQGTLSGGTLGVRRKIAQANGDAADVQVGGALQDGTTGYVYTNQGTFGAPVWVSLANNPPLRGGNGVVAYGDSITDSNQIDYGFVNLVQGSQSWAGATIAATDGALRLLHNSAQNGMMTADCVAAFQNDVLVYNPSYLLLLIGINDQNPTNPLATSEAAAVANAMANIKTIITRCFQNGIQPILCTLVGNSQTQFAANYGTVANRHSYINSFNASLREMIARHPLKIPLLDLHAVTSDAAGNFIAGYSGDLLHPNANGQNAIQAYAAPELVKIIGADMPKNWLIDSIDQGPNAVTNGMMLDGYVTGFTSLVGGTAYGANSTVALSGGGGAGATASLTIVGGVITAINVLDPGHDYTSAPTVTITPIGGGSGASATAVISSAANGVPDNWTTYGAATTNTVVAPPAGVAGRAYKTVPSGGSVAGIFQDVSNSAGLGFAAGDHMAFSGRFVTSGMNAAGANGSIWAMLTCYTTPGVGALYNVNSLYALNAVDIALGRWYDEFTIPVGCTSIRIFFQAGGNASAFAEWMQCTLINLTRMGQATAFPGSDPRL